MTINWTPTKVKLRDLIPWEHNPRKISKRRAQRLLQSWNEYGQVATIAIGPNGEVYDGHQRLSVLKQAFGDDYEVLALQSSTPLSEEQRKKLVLLLHEGATGAWDLDMLKDWDREILYNTGIDEETELNSKALANLARELAEAFNEEEPFADVEPQFTKKDNAAFEITSERITFKSNLPYDIPPLREDKLAAIPEGITVWTGERSTNLNAPAFFYVYPMDSTIHLDYKRTVIGFYAYDIHWDDAVWLDFDTFTAKLLSANILAALSPDYSVFPDSAKAENIWQVYRARWNARFWQEAGINVIPSLQIAPNIKEIITAGIPKHCPTVAFQLQFITPGREDHSIIEAELIADALNEIQPQSIFVYTGTTGERVLNHILDLLHFTPKIVKCETRANARRAYIKRGRSKAKEVNES